MRSRILVSLMVIVVVFAFVTLTPAIRPTQAQADKTTVCDSTLITLTYLAEHDYGYHSSMDLSKFEKGQFKPWFDAMMAMTGANMQGTADAMMAATPAAMMQGTQDASTMMTELKPGSVSGEDPACSALRTEVEGYLAKTISQGMMKK